jgi:uncharacterized protein (TIGR02145 family)
MKWTNYLWGMILVLTTFWSCQLDLIQEPLNEDPHFKLKPETIVFEEDLQEQVRAVEPDRIIIAGTGAQSPDIESGSIILSRPAEGAPAGFLRKVIRVETQGNETVYFTEPASLPDAFESYTWNYQPRMKTGSIFRDASDLTLDTIDTVYVFDLGQIGNLDLTMELELQLAYQIELVSFIDYSFPEGVTSSRIGFDRFQLNDLSFTKTFKLNGDDFSGIQAYDALSEALERDILTLALNPVPIDPPTSLVWVQPVLSLKGILGCMFEARYSNQIRLYNTTPAKGIVNYDQSTGTTTIERQLPDNFIMEVNVGMEGSISIETGVRLEIGLAPYTRGLFTLGVGLDNSLINTLSGNFDVSFRTDTTADLVAGLEFRTAVKVAGDIFIDGEFFGFAPDVIDGQFQVFESIFNIYKYGVEIENCFTVFKGISASVICEGSDEVSLFFDALTINDIFLGEGRYQIIITSDTDTLELPSLYLFGASQEADLSELEPGNYKITYIYWEDLVSPTNCIRTTTITIPDCNSTIDNNCGPEGFVLIADQPYCIYQDHLGREWLASNLKSEIRTCYEDIPLNCEVYGGLYTYEEALNICPLGWRLPSQEEWRELLEAGTADVSVDGNRTIIPGAYFFKDKNYWGIQNIGEPGFNVKPSGYQTPIGGFSHLGRYAYLWTATDADDPENANAMAVIFSDTSNNAIISPNLKTNKMSCRCIKAN